MARHHRLKLAVLPQAAALVLLWIPAFASESPKMVWLHRPGFNCFPDNGAETMPGWKAVEEESLSFEACKSTCEAFDECTAVMVLTGNVTGICGLRKNIRLSQCTRDNGYELWEHVLESPPLPNGVWESFGNDTVCRVDADDDSEEGAGTVMIYGTPTLDRCKAVCGTSDSCYGIEYMAESQRCEVWTQPVDYVKPRQGYECFAFESGDLFPFEGTSNGSLLSMKASILHNVITFNPAAGIRGVAVLLLASVAALIVGMAPAIGLYRFLIRRQSIPAHDEEAVRELLPTSNN